MEPKLEQGKSRFTPSGLYEDALNAYTWLGSLFIDGPAIKKLLQQKIRTYEEYLTDTQTSDEVSDILSGSNSETVKQLNGIVEKYNELVVNGEVSHKIAKEYSDMIVALFREKKNSSVAMPLIGEDKDKK